jgi:undecaprenyl-diphosphatase
VVGLAARWVARHPEQIHAARDRLLARPHVARLRVRYRRQLESLARRFHPEGALGLSLTASVLVLVAAGWAFGAVLQDVLAGESLDQVDRPVLRFFVAHREPWATSAARMLTWLGSSAVLIPLLLAVGLGWWWRSGRRQPLGLLAGGYAGSWVLSTAIKDLVGRPRPPHAVALTHASGFAFPSGHATDATVAWLLLASLATAGTPRWSAKVAWWAGAVALSVVVGLTRLYLGVHWLTDVTGGFALGLVWVTILLATIRTFPFMRRQPVRPRRHAPANRS